MIKQKLTVTITKMISITRITLAADITKRPKDSLNKKFSNVF